MEQLLSLQDLGRGYHKVKGFEWEGDYRPADKETVRQQLASEMSHWTGRPEYRTATPGVSNTDCVALLNGIFTYGGGSGCEINQGSDPGDQRSTVIGAGTSTDYLQSPYPDGFTSWSGVFDKNYTPAN